MRHQTCSAKLGICGRALVNVDARVALFNLKEPSHRMGISGSILDDEGDRSGIDRIGTDRVAAGSAALSR